MKRRREVRAQRLAGEERRRVQRMILSVLFRVFPWQTRFFGLYRGGAPRSSAHDYV